MTKEELLIKTMIEGNGTFKEKVHAAMQSYADQQCSEKDKRIALLEQSLPVREGWVNDETKEKARLYAESKMPEGWDRNDGIYIGVFYKHFIDFLSIKK